LDKRKGRRSGEQEIRVQVIRKAGYQVKEQKVDDGKVGFDFWVFLGEICLIFCWPGW